MTDTPASEEAMRPNVPRVPCPSWCDQGHLTAPAEDVLPGQHFWGDLGAILRPAGTLRPETLSWTLCAEWIEPANRHGCASEPVIELEARAVDRYSHESVYAVLRLTGGEARSLAAALVRTADQVELS